MEISFLQIQNFKSIENMILRDIGSALILVGKNSVGKSSILQAIAAAMGEYHPSPFDFNIRKQNIEISLSLSMSSGDLELLFHSKKVSPYKRWDSMGFLVPGFLSEASLLSGKSADFYLYCQPERQHPVSRWLS